MAKKPHADERGCHVLENFFVGGRWKRRVTVIDGQVIDDPDEWLLANADDGFLHQIERWDLIGRRMTGDEEPPTQEPSMKHPSRKLHLDIHELESAFEFRCRVNPDFCDEPCVSFLDMATGRIVAPEDEEEADAMLDGENLLELPDDLFESWSNYGALEEFVDSLPADPLRDQLEKAICGKGAFRRFKDMVFGAGNVELRHRWEWFETRRKRERIVGWLQENNIDPEWGRDIFEEPPLPDKRPDLLRAVLAFRPRRPQTNRRPPDRPARLPHHDQGHPKGR